jgi:hypothetical protein
LLLFFRLNKALAPAKLCFFYFTGYTKIKLKEKNKMKTNSKLSKKKLSLIIVGSAVLLGGVACAIALPLTYCGPKNPVESPRAIDGSD